MSNISENPVAYAEYNLSILGKGLLGLTTNSDFREVLYTEVDKQFDNEHNVLLKTLNQTCHDQGIDMCRISQIFLVENNIQSDFESTLAGAFKNIDGIDYYPQIFIPFFEEVLERNNNLGEYEKPVLVIYTGDETQLEYNGFNMNEKGELIQLDFKIDEVYAERHEVWVLSINERTNSALKNDDASNGRESQIINAFYSFITVKCHKESWAAGASEVWVVRRSTWYDARNPNTGQDALFIIGTERGNQIIKRKRRDVKRKRYAVINWTYWDGLDTNTWGDYYIYVVFEYDAWPTGERTEQVVIPPGVGVPIKYRSADGPYVSGFRFLFDGVVYNLNEPCIDLSSGL